MRILVTGGYGYIGAHLVRHFAAKGDDVTVLGRTEHPAVAERLPTHRFVSADVSLASELAGACDSMDAVVHGAALNAQQSERDGAGAALITGVGTLNMLDEAERAGIGRFVYLSTFHVYGPQRAPVLDELSPLNPVAHYGAAHLLAEAYCHRAAHKGSLRPVITRISNVYGPPVDASADCWTLIVNEFCRQAVQDGRVLLRSSGAGVRDFVSMDDVAVGVDALLGLEPGQVAFPAVYNLGGEDALSIREVAEIVAHEASSYLDAPIGLDAPEPAPDSERVPFRYSSDRLTGLGYRPSGDLRAGIRATLECLVSSLGRP